jgi:tetratricopeptide (TPR) repeat protein
MEAKSEQRGKTATAVSIPSTSVVARRLFVILSLAALAYAFLAGLRTVTDWDLGWQMATGRWIVQHHQIPSTDVLSYTAQGKPWEYPVASGLIFYLVYLAGNYTLLSVLGAAACVSTVALLLRRGSWVTAALAILAIPRIALRSTPRAEIFTVVLFAAFLSLLWQQYETGRARLWLLPLMMMAWVNLHLGLTAGLGLIAGYVLLECLEMVWPSHRRSAIHHLRRAWPWFLATLGAMLVNPWGWRVFATSLHLMTPMTARSQKILEWAPTKLNWTIFVSGFSLRSPNTFVVLLLVVAIAVPVALMRRQLGAAVWLCGAAFVGIRSQRLQVLFSIVVVIVAESVLTSALASLQRKIADARLSSILATGACCFMVLLVFVWSGDLVTNRAYMGRTDLASFGTGLGWWFPEGAAAFIDRENIPRQIFNSYSEGGYFTWRLGAKYLDYIDGRGDPFGEELFDRNGTLHLTPPDSPEWQREAERYDINAIMLPLARYNALQFFPLLPQFCTSKTWRPVYLDEVSVVLLRRRPETESLVQRLQIDCATAPLPEAPPSPGENRSKAFNQWANAAAVLHVLGRHGEAFSATTRALAIFPDSAFVHFLRGNLFEEAGNLPDAEQQYLLAAGLEGNAATWSTLASLYHRQGKVTSEIDALEHAIDLLPNPDSELLSLGYADLDAHRPREALVAFERAIASQPARVAMSGDNSFVANVAHGRALAWSALGDLQRAISFQEETVGLAPDRFDDWTYLANLYDQVGRSEDARKARGHTTANQLLNLKP